MFDVKARVWQDGILILLVVVPVMTTCLWSSFLVVCVLAALRICDPGLANSTPGIAWNGLLGDMSLQICTLFHYSLKGAYGSIGSVMLSLVTSRCH